MHTLLLDAKTTKNQLEVLPRHEALKEREAVNFNNVVRKELLRPRALLVAQNWRHGFKLL